jgi:uncharacterized RDD family membrane protein YckC
MDARPVHYAAAGFPRRVAAYLIDSLAITFVWFLVFFGGAAVAADPNDETTNEAVGMALFLAGPAIWFLYHWVSNSTGVSVGKKRMSLAVRRLPDGARPGMRRGFIRTVGQALGALPLWLGFWWALWDSRRQTWHDKMAGTFVVRVKQATAAEPRAPRWLPRGMRAKYAEYYDPLALTNALEAPLPLDAASTPLDVPLGPGPREPRYALYFLATTLPLVLFHFAIGFSPELPTILLVVAEVFVVIASGVELSGLNRRLQVSGDGIRVVKIYRTRTIPWSQVQRVEAKADLLSMRVLGQGVRVSWSCRLVPPDKRRDIIVAIRARLPVGASILEWPKEGQLRARVFRFVLNGAAAALFIAASFTGATGSYPGASASSQTLGLRCAVSSHYLRERFGLRAERGCVVLRVSGPAKAAGLRQGDLMIAMNDIPITSGEQFSILFETSSQSHFTFSVLRPGSDAPKDFVVDLGSGGSPLKEDPDEPLFYYLRARSDTGRRHVERDLADFTRAIELAPDLDLAYLYRGELRWELGDRYAARQDYERALDLDPDLGEAHRHLVYVLLADRDLGAARASIEKAIALDGCEDGFTDYNIDCAEGLYLLAATYEHPDFPKGIEAAERSIEFYSDFAEPYFQLAYFHYYLGDREKARDYAQRYLSFPGVERESDKSQQAHEILESS